MLKDFEGELDMNADTKTGSGSKPSEKLTRIRRGHPDLFNLYYRDSEGGFSAQLVIQHHDKVVTNSDIGKSRRGLYR